MWTSLQREFSMLVLDGEGGDGFVAYGRVNGLRPIAERLGSTVSQLAPGSFASLATILLQNHRCRTK